MEKNKMIKDSDWLGDCADCPKCQLDKSGDLVCMDGLALGWGCASHDQNIMDAELWAQKSIEKYKVKK